MLMCIDETNMALRVLLGFLKVHPAPPKNMPTTSPEATAPPLDLNEYKRGGLVGALERMLVFIFVVNAAFGAVGFILTAKGVVRFQEITCDHSAEYILIGTLISTLFAIALGLLVPHLRG